MAWGAHVGSTTPKKLLPCPSLPCSHCCLHSLDVAPSMAPTYAHTSRPQPRIFFTTTASRRTAPQMMTRDELPHDHPGYAPFLWMCPGPLTCPAPSQHAAAIPHTSHMPFMCPSPSHNLTHLPWPPSTCPDVFRCTPPLLHCHPLACPFTLSLTGYVPTLYHVTYTH